MSLPSFEVFIPATLAEAISFYSENRDSTKIIAGGTDVVPSLKQRLFEPQYLLDMKGVRELTGIQNTMDGGLRIGALTTITQVATHPVIAQHFPVLQRAAATVAGPGLRNVGTLGGNICLDTRCYWYNQSYFWRQSCGFCIKKDGTMCHVAPGSKKCWAVYSGDTAAALLTLDAKIRLQSAGRDRLMPLSDFFLNDGAIRNRLEPGEILTEILVPPTARGYAGAYEKFRLRGSVDYPLAGIAVAIKKPNGNIEDLRIGLTAVNPLPVLMDTPLQRLDSETIEDLQKLAMRTAKPLKTSASTIEYRRHMVGMMLKRALEKLNSNGGNS
jgi:4-hydroxybenzoyl-CoA reductase subunit beta